MKIFVELILHAYLEVVRDSVCNRWKLILHSHQQNTNTVSYTGFSWEKIRNRKFEFPDRVQVVIHLFSYFQYAKFEGERHQSCGFYEEGHFKLFQQNGFNGWINKEPA